MSENEVKEHEVVEERAIAASFKEDGLIQFKDHKEVAAAARFLITIKLAPEHLTKLGVGAVTSALIFCQQRNLPYSALNEIGVVKGKAGAFGSLITALAKRDPNYGEMVVLYVNEKMEVISLENKNLKDDVYACVIRIKKKNSDVWNEYYFTKDEAKTAGLLSNNTYQKYLKDMLYHRAKFRAMKTEYPDSLEGVESYEILSEEADVRDVSAADDINKRLGLLEE